MIGDNLKQYLLDWYINASKQNAHNLIKKYQKPSWWREDTGLCTNYAQWRMMKDKGRILPGDSLTELLMEEFGDDDFPFGYSQYDEDSTHGTHHLCLARLQWVEEKLREANGGVYPAKVVKATLRRYLLAYVSFCISGEPPPWMDRSSAICDNLHYWCDHNQTKPELRSQVEAVLEAMLKQTKGSPTFPFGGIDLYQAESRSSTHHLNKERVRWARFAANAI